MAYNIPGNQPVSGNSNPYNRQPGNPGPQPNPYIKQTYNQPQQMPQAQPSYVINVNNAMMNESQLPPQFQALSPLAYFGYTILFAIPIIGFIFVLVYSFGACQNVNLRNYARSYFCVFIIVLALIGILIMMSLLLGISFQLYLHRYF